MKKSKERKQTLENSRKKEHDKKKKERKEEKKEHESIRSAFIIMGVI